VDTTDRFEPSDLALTQQMREAASWHIAAELSRRYPHELTVHETHPGGGQYDCLAVQHVRRGHLVDLNRSGSFHVWLGGSDGPSDSTPWQAGAVSSPPRDPLDRLCRSMKLAIPNRLPRSTPRTIVYRFIAAFLAHAVFAVEPWRCLNGMCDTSGYGGGLRRRLFGEFPAAMDCLSTPLPEDALGEPEYRFWFLCCDDEPHVCLETTGMAWTRDGGSHDLEALYR